MPTREDEVRRPAEAVDGADRLRGMLWGMFVGDALAMPVHWYYDRAALVRDYGEVRDDLAPRNPHPDSILWRSRYRPANERGEILHDQARYWGKRGVHYHQHLRPGENTLNLQLAEQLIDSLLARDGYDADDYLERYVAFMRTPGSHRDTYVEECHRGFFTNYARGLPPRACGIEDIHIGGLSGIWPIVAAFADDPELLQGHLREHVGLTHRSQALLGKIGQLVNLERRRRSC